MSLSAFFFFFNDTATTEIYTLSLHDALPIFRPAEVALHYVGPANRQEPLLAVWRGLECGRVGEAHAPPGQWLADLAALGAYLAEAGSAEVARIHADHRGALGAAIALERADAKGLLEGQGEPLRQLFGADQHVLQAAEILGQAAAQVGLQECRCGQQKRDAVIAHQLADRGQVKGARMVHRSEEHTSELQSRLHLVCRLLLEKKKKKQKETAN